MDTIHTIVFYGILAIFGAVAGLGQIMWGKHLAELRRIRRANHPDTLEDVLTQILVLHDRLEAIAHRRRVDRDRVGTPVGKLVE